jgi:hypothetical protein
VASLKDDLRWPGAPYITTLAGKLVSAVRQTMFQSKEKSDEEAAWPPKLTVSPEWVQQLHIHINAHIPQRGVAIQILPIVIKADCSSLTTTLDDILSRIPHP